MKKYKILIIKPSSIGDIFHVFPGLDLFRKSYPNCEIHWLVDQKFRGAVELFDSEVIIHDVHRSKIKALSKIFGSWVFIFFMKKQQSIDFDYILDLSFRESDVRSLKHLKVPICGLSEKSLRQLQGDVLITDINVANSYDVVIDLPKSWSSVEFKNLPYVELYKLLLMKSAETYLDDKIDVKPLIEVEQVIKSFDKEGLPNSKYGVFFHSSSGAIKNWKLDYWKELGELCTVEGYQIYLPWGNEDEKRRCEEISRGLSNCHVLPRLSLQDVSRWIEHSEFVVGCDTGFTHLASLHNKPTVRIWGPISKNAGVASVNSLDLVSAASCAPCGKTNYCKLANPNKALEEPVCYDLMVPDKAFKLLIELVN